MSQQDIQEIVQQALSQMQQQQPQQTSWQGQSFSAIPEVLGVHIPIKLQTSKGSIRVYLPFDKQWGESAEKLQELIDTLESMGFPLDVWQSQSSGWGNNNRQYSNYRKPYYKRY